MPEVKEALVRSMASKADGAAAHRFWAVPVVLSLLLTLTCLAYWPGLHGYFSFDDASNLIDNNALQTHELSWTAAWQAMWSGNAGPLRRPLAMLSFWGNVITTGMKPFWFKLTNLAIHGGNGLLVYGLVKALAAGRGHAQAGRLAILAAGLFLLHPLQLSSVLYVVQRMTSLSAMFVLLGLLWYVRLRSRWKQRHGMGVALQAMAVLGLAAVLAALTKENGVLVVPFALVLDMTLLEESADRRLWLVYGSLLVLPGLWLLNYLTHHGQGMIQGYASRGVALWPHWLSAARVLWLYLGLIFWPRQSALGLYHDDFAPSSDLFHPPATLVALAGWVVMLVGAGLLRRRAPWFSCAVLWFVVGHSMEALLNLELVHEHRNYLPILGPIMAVAACLAPGAETNRLHLGRLGTGLAALALLAGLTLATAERATVWGQSVLWGLSEAAHHPHSARAHLQAAMGATLVARRLQKNHQDQAAALLYARAQEHLQQARRLDDQAVVADFGLLLLDGLQRQDTPQKQLRALRLRLATGPVHISLSSVLVRLVEWQQQGLTRLPHGEVIGLFEAALANPHTPASVRGMENALLGKYYGAMLHDGQKALRYTIAATRSDPSTYQHQLSLASLALQLGDAALARQSLQRAAELDPLHRGAVRRRELGMALAAFEQDQKNHRPWENPS